MTRDDIIRMAREADPGFDGGEECDGTMTDSIVGIDQVLMFAALVAAAEREACAQIVERNAAACRTNSDLHDILSANALAIRQRGAS